MDRATFESQKAFAGEKQACNKAFRELMPVEFVAVTQQHAEQKTICRTKERRKYPLCGALIINKV